MKQPALSTRAIAALSITLPLLLGCQTTDQTSPSRDSMVPSPSSAPGGISAPPSPTPEPKPQFSDVLDDQDGYKGIPWGCKSEDFIRLKSLQDRLPRPNNQVLSSYTAAGNSGVWADSDRSTLGNLLNVPTSPHPRMRVLAFKFVPAKFADIHLKEEDVTYIFYEDELAMVFSTLDVTNYDTYLSQLSEKHTEVDRFRITTADWVDPEGQHDLAWQDVILFKKAGTNTRIYLTKTDERWGNIPASPSAYVLQAPNYFYSKITTEILTNKAQAEAKAEAERAEREQAKLQRDLGKLP